jgi:AcrR family transcriptional regulator
MLRNTSHAKSERGVMTNSEAAARGRPRDPRIEPTVLETTRQILGTEGFNAATVQEIARRSCTSAPAIYRRWPTRLALIEDAAFSTLTEIAVSATGDLRADLRLLVEGFHGSLDTPAARAAIPGLIAAYQHEPPPPTQWLKFSVRSQFYEIVETAGAVPGLDVDEIFDVLHGTLLARIFVPLAADHALHIDTIVEMLVRILAPATPATPATPAPPRHARARRTTKAGEP